MSKLDDLSAWRLFCSLCNTRNFSDTAGEFDVEVSTVSRALTSLENALGQTLILRVTRPLQLTESGQIAYEHASNILLQHEEMVKELTQSSAGMAGKIRLSLAPGSVAVYIPMLMEFNSQYPEIVFDIVGGGNVQDISRGRNVYVPVASRRYIEEHGMPLHPKDLAAHTVLVYDGSVRSATRYLENGDKREEVKWKQVLRVSNILAIKKSVIDGLGISVDLPLFHCAQEIASGILVPILPGWVHPPVECFVCTSKTNWRIRRHRVFLQWFQTRLVQFFKSKEDMVAPFWDIPQRTIVNEI